MNTWSEMLFLAEVWALSHVLVPLSSQSRQGAMSVGIRRNVPDFCAVFANGDGRGWGDAPGGTEAPGCLLSCSPVSSMNLTACRDAKT